MARLKTGPVLASPCGAPSASRKQESLRKFLNYFRKMVKELP